MMNSLTGTKRFAMTAVLAATIGSPLYVFDAFAAPQKPSAATRMDADVETDVITALAHSPQLQGQQITAATIQGDVTLSGTVSDAATKQLAEQIAAGVSGVRSVQNNLTVSNTPVQPPAQPSDQQSEQVPPPPPYDQGVANPDQAENQQNYPSPAQQQAPGYPQQPNYPQQQPGYPQQQPGYPQQQQQPVYQQPSGPVTIPSGTLLNVRTSELLDSRKTQVGTMFQATVADDIYQGNALAIPRGAVLTGQVTGVKKPGDLTGKPGLQLQLTALNLGGQSYPLTTETWTGEGPGKGGYSTANTAGGAALGAMIGAIAGGGVGAAVGAVAGGTTGLAASAATKGPQVVIPPEAVLSFHLATPVTVTPVSYQEAQRLQASVTPQQPRLVRRPVYAYPYPYPYYGYPYPYPYYYRPGYYYYPR
ncbi:BON domain-containing protein [Alloacidobacterium dinghuense]|uniref:BON domain-containing protein n=1 Tax=Alloacidobacterium dinghuense TaxID=2763107 RepID=A0A7G8BP76_9BACT|nr:BON domain-containing protein [Alloacidobacterium dinghuense]QNI34346.1 BON domain-containing protein [Alloacidobacterium dinghuense]